MFAATAHEMSSSSSSESDWSEEADRPLLKARPKAWRRRGLAMVTLALGPALAALAFVLVCALVRPVRVLGQNSPLAVPVVLVTAAWLPVGTSVAGACTRRERALLAHLVAVVVATVLVPSLVVVNNRHIGKLDTSEFCRQIGSDTGLDCSIAADVAGILVFALSLVAVSFGVCSRTRHHTHAAQRTAAEQRQQANKQAPTDGIDGGGVLRVEVCALAQPPR